MSAPSKTPMRIAAANAGASVLLTGPLLWVHHRFGSQLALAQAADSFTDALTALALLLSLRVAVQPPDDEHPRGHHSAEPIAALFAAVLAGVLAIEVLRAAITALAGEVRPTMQWPLAAVFALKMAIKTTIVLAARRRHMRTGSPALRAIEVDSRNDVLVGMLALGGFFVARYDSPAWDAWLAMPIAGWIAASGIGLARENIRLLMGEAPPPERQAALLATAAAIEGVHSVHDLVARHDGTHLDVTLHIVVDENLSVRTAHDIAEAVEARLMQEPDVTHAMAHVDVEPD